MFLDEDSNNIYTMSASRNFWGTVWGIQTVNIPKEQEQKGEYTLSFAKTVGNIEKDRKSIEEFEDFLSSIGIRAYSLEYKSLDKKFYLIDFDTENDKKVITELERSKLLEERE